jgi:succinyldiaminopimelate transaminase
MNSRLQRLPIHPTLQLEERKAELRARGVRVFDFGTGDPPDAAPPFVREAMVAAIPELAGYPPVGGNAALREAAAAYLQQRFGAELDPQTEIISTNGSKEAIFHLALVLIDGGGRRDTVVYGVPGYAAFEIGTCFAGGRDHRVELSAEKNYLFGPDDVGGEVLSRTAVVFLNYPHNPTGQDMPPALLRRWVEARAEYGFVIVADECYCDLYVDQPPHSLIEFGREGCIAVHSLSKRSGMTGYLTGFLAGDAGLIALQRRFRAGMGVATPVWTQAAAAAAWREPTHVAERRATFAEKRRIMAELLRSRGLRVYGGNAALFHWVEVPAGETDRSYAERLARAGILVAPGAYFGPGQERFVRLAMVPSAAECRDVAAVWPR